MMMGFAVGSPTPPELW